jgi:hypothetical protein
MELVGFRNLNMVYTSVLTFFIAGLGAFEDERPKGMNCTADLTSCHFVDNELIATSSAHGDLTDSCAAKASFFFRTCV